MFTGLKRAHVREPTHTRIRARARTQNFDGCFSEPLIHLLSNMMCWMDFSLARFYFSHAQINTRLFAVSVCMY